jgi:hypothetical protein
MNELDEIKERWGLGSGGVTSDALGLHRRIDTIDTVRDIARLIDKIESLRDLLARLEWRGTAADSRRSAGCPACYALAPFNGGRGHDLNCELAKELVLEP